MKEVMSHAALRPFNRKWGKLPGSGRKFNDDAHAEAYRPSDMTYDGKQRKGIRANLEARSSMRGHVSRAVRERVPLSADTPIHRDTMASAFVRDCRPERVKGHWSSHMQKLEQMVQEATLPQAKRNEEIPDRIIPSGGNSIQLRSVIG